MPPSGSCASTAGPPCRCAQLSSKWQLRAGVAEWWNARRHGALPAAVGSSTAASEAGACGCCGHLGDPRVAQPAPELNPSTLPLTQACSVALFAPFCPAVGSAPELPHRRAGALQLSSEQAETADERRSKALGRTHCSVKWRSCSAARTALPSPATLAACPCTCPCTLALPTANAKILHLHFMTSRPRIPRPRSVALFWPQPHSFPTPAFVSLGPALL